MKHLTIFKGDAAEKILFGQKTVECRLSKSKIPPFGVVSAGDLVYIKVYGGEIIGQFRVQKVIFFDGLDINDLRYLSNLSDLGEFWEGNKVSRYGTLIFIGSSIRFITSPIKLKKKDLKKSWVVLE